MTRLALITFILSIAKLSIGQEDSIIGSTFEAKIINYMQAEERNSNERIDSFRVYIVYIYDIADSSKSFKFTLGYMLNSSDYRRYAEKVYGHKRINGHTVLLMMDKRNLEIFDKIGFVYTMDINILINAVQRLYPPIPLAGFTYRPMQYVGEYSDGNVHGKFVNFGEKVEEDYRLF